MTYIFNMAGQRNPQKVALIISTALELLREAGDQGLTMRQVSVRSGMSLSNLQHYFKNKDALLIGLIDHYLEDCIAGMNMQLQEVKAKGPARFVAMVAFTLESPEAEPICRTFKEFWAIAERNPTIKSHLAGYYRTYVDLLGQELSAIAPDCPRDRIDQAVSMLVPLIEGYAVTRTALPLDAAEMTTLITDQTLAMVGATAD